MGRIVVVTTGGTIAGRRRGAGLAAGASGREVLSRAVVPPGVSVEVVDLCTLDSPLMTTARQLTLLRKVHQLFAREDVEGIVVTHGTDTLEETAFLLDLHHHDTRPVVFTGAQQPLDHPGDDDGRRNLHDALLVASAVTGAGTLVAFGGKLFAARGTVKSHTLAVDAFSSTEDGPIGEVRDGTVTLFKRPGRPAPIPMPPRTVPQLPLRVDMVMHHSDADPALLRAAVAGGARGVVLVATGAGNATPAFTAAVAEATAGGVLVALTTRVPGGPVAELYTNGGAVDLVAAGAVPTGLLRAGQARIAVLGALLASDEQAERRRLLHHVLALPAPYRAA
ncbi:asparaginase [Kitasatospora sp. NPDC002965]|uniref:asparaginase n=1 Tax=Kitasatospora sp. NPDC002965 TaxID=3154775 RepID=UPI0033BF5CE6